MSGEEEIPTKPEGKRTAAGELLDVFADLGDDERRVLIVLARRLLEGQRCYGRLDLLRDARDFRRERALELADLLVYTAFAELSASMKGQGVF